MACWGGWGITCRWGVEVEVGNGGCGIGLGESWVGDWGEKGRTGGLGVVREGAFRAACWFSGSHGMHSAE